MATILNKQSREDIKHAIIHSTFAEREAALIKQAADVAQRVYEAGMPEGFLTATKSLPAEWFVRHSEMDIRVDKKRQYLRNGQCSWSLPGARSFPAAFGRYSAPDVDLVTGKHDQLIAEIVGTRAEFDAIETERSQLGATLTTLLASVRTVEKFQEAAPELADYIPDSVKKSSQRGGLPAVLVGDLVTGLMKAGLKVPKAG